MCCDLLAAPELPAVVAVRSCHARVVNVVAELAEEGGVEEHMEEALGRLPSHPQEELTVGCNKVAEIALLKMRLDGF